ncbi:MAG: lipid-A-disaccharide synthase-related protein [bacterium]|nr:lipid-A-disaccharide synthase-related protein [bacterium]
MPNVLFLSNCYGEDRSAAIIASALKKIRPDTNIIGVPLISGGEEYEKRNIPVLLKTKVPPSGGFTTRSLAGILDVLTGFYIPIRYCLALKKLRPKTDSVMITGDVFLLILGWLGTRKPIFFLAPAKSDYQNPHYKVELWIMKSLIHKKQIKQIFTHDEYTANNLRKNNIPATFVGNPMVDELKREHKFKPEKNSITIGILPGSRTEAYKNFIKILKIVELLEQKNLPKLSFVTALPNTIKLNTLTALSQNNGWKLSTDDISVLTKKDTKVFLYYNAFVDIIEQADIIIGLAGTANEQAAYFGKPIVAFKGTGPQTSNVRMNNQQNLLGGCLKVVKNFPDGVVNEILFLLQHPDEIKRRSKIGKFRMGPSGGAERIAERIFLDADSRR